VDEEGGTLSGTEGRFIDGIEEGLGVDCEGWHYWVFLVMDRI
jgi:hypothetical protein